MWQFKRPNDQFNTMDSVLGIAVVEEIWAQFKCCLNPVINTSVTSVTLKEVNTCCFVFSFTSDAAGFSLAVSWWSF